MLTSLFQDESSNIKDIPTLIIDDECDHHSLNSKDYQNEVRNLSEKQEIDLMKFIRLMKEILGKVFQRHTQRVKNT